MAVIEGDDFHAGGTGLRDDSPEAREAACMDSPPQQPVLETLRAGRQAVWRAFDRETFDGRLSDEVSRLRPRTIVILEGVYAACTELADLLDLRVILAVPDAVRVAASWRVKGLSVLGNGNGIRRRMSVPKHHAARSFRCGRGVFINDATQAA